MRRAYGRPTPTTNAPRDPEQPLKANALGRKAQQRPLEPPCLEHVQRIRRAIALALLPPFAPLNLQTILLRMPFVACPLRDHNKVLPFLDVDRTGFLVIISVALVLV